jgi:hypothetical protein
MTLLEVKQKISELTQKQRSLINELAEVSSEIGKSNNLLHQMNLDLFGEYLKVGFTIELQNYFNFKMTPLSGSESVYIRPGCVLELSKINKRTFVFKLTKYVKRTNNVDDISHPNWQYRIKIEDMYHFLTRDTNFKNSFDNWQNRENILNELLNGE